MIKSDLCNPPNLLSKSLKPDATPAILPSLLKASLIIFTASFNESPNFMYFLSALPELDKLYKSFSALSIRLSPVLSVFVSLVS
jgi:hypothetical protein